MSTAISRAGQKWKEFMGSKKTHDIKLEDKKAEVNELDGYLRMAARAFTSIAQLHSQLQLYMTQLGQIIAKVYEHETAQNKEIGQNLTNMFSSIAEIQQKKVEKLALTVNHFKEWFSTIDQLKILLIRYDDDRLVYDHYKMKVDELQKTEAKGGKYQERYQRNVNKLSNANTQFQKITKEIYFKMTTILNKRYFMINSAVSELISEQFDIYSESAKFIKPNLLFLQKFKDNNLDNQIAYDDEDEDQFIKETKKKLNIQKSRIREEQQVQQQQMSEQKEIKKKQSQLINDFDTPTPDPDQPQSQIKQNASKLLQKPPQPQQPHQPQQQQQDLIRKRQVLNNPFEDEEAQYFSQQQPRQSMQQNQSFYRASYQTQNNPFQEDDQEQQYEFQRQQNNPFDIDNETNSLPQNMPSSMMSQQQLYYQQNAQLQQQYRQFQSTNPFNQQQGQVQQNNPFQEQKQSNPFL